MPAKHVILACFLASCDAPTVVLTDGTPMPDADLCDIGGCNPVSQTGCGVGEKCTWLRLDSTAGTGVLACVPDQPVADGDACAFGPDGPTTGYDDCARGSICVEGACRPLCIIAPNSCAHATCEQSDGLFCPQHGFGACAP